MKLSLFSIVFFLIISLFQSSCRKSNIINISEANGNLKKIFGDTTHGISGRVEIYDLNRRLIEEANYHNGLLEGERKIYENGILIALETREKDLFQGPVKSFYPNGALMVEGQYEQNITAGIWKSYYPSGSLRDEAVMANNEENGPFKEYYENGKIKAIGTFVKGKNEQDSLKLFDSTGTHIKTMFCKEGICETIWKK